MYLLYTSLKKTKTKLPSFQFEIMKPICYIGVKISYLILHSNELKNDGVSLFYHT